MQEELQVPHQRRVGLLEAEVERHRQMYCKARRDHERCKVCHLLFFRWAFFYVVSSVYW